MERIVNPISDFFVRYLLGSEENKDILLDFINAFLADSGFQTAAKVKIKNPFNLKTIINSKESILDVKAIDENRRIFDVEIQVIGNSRYIKRTLYYWAKNYHGQLSESENYNELKPVICINILDFILFNDLKKSHCCFLPIEKEETENVLTDDFQIHFFELPKMQTGDIFKINERLKKWAIFFNNEGLMNEEEEMKILLKNDPVMKKAHRIYKEFSADNEILQVYEAREKRIRDESTRLADAKEEGLIQGLKQGKEKERREIALNMLKEGMSLELASKITGYSIEKLNEFTQS